VTHDTQKRSACPLFSNKAPPDLISIMGGLNIGKIVIYYNIFLIVAKLKGIPFINITELVKF